MEILTIPYLTLWLEGETLGLHRERASQMNTPDTITIRRESPADRPALDRLAGRDSQHLPSDEFLLAEVGGELWAAVGMNSGVLVADPFRPSGEVAEFLRVRAERARDQVLLARPAPPLLRLARRAVAWSRAAT
jgi:hypothetical protein